MITTYCKTGETICPLFQYCIARLNDNTIEGCGLPLFLAGVVAWEDIGVKHIIKGGVPNETKIL